MNKNIVLCGVGGQGTVLASKLIAAAAMKKNIPVMSAETIGMAQRGGSVFSHIRMGEGLYSPMIAKGRHHHRLRAGGNGPHASVSEGKRTDHRKPACHYACHRRSYRYAL